jgi:hypothetical protein
MDVTINVVDGWTDGTLLINKDILMSTEKLLMDEVETFCTVHFCSTSSIRPRANGR